MDKLGDSNPYRRFFLMGWLGGIIGFIPPATSETLAGIMATGNVVVFSIVFFLVLSLFAIPQMFIGGIIGRYFHSGEIAFVVGALLSIILISGIKF